MGNAASPTGLEPLNELARHLFAFAELMDVSLSAKERPELLALQETIAVADGSTLPEVLQARADAAAARSSDPAPLGEIWRRQGVLDRDRETRDVRERALDVSARVLAHLLRRLAELAGDSLSVRFLSGARIELAATPELDPETVQGVLRRLRDAPGESLTLVLKLDKKTLLERYVQADDLVARYFICRENVTAHLARPLTDIEKAFEEAGRDGKLVLLAALADLALDGPHLAVVGGEYLRDWRKYAARRPGPGDDAPRDERLVRPGEMAEDAVEKVNWIDLHFQLLTPLHLDVEPSAPGYDAAKCDVARTVYSRLLDLCLAYSANQTRRTREGRAAEPRADDWTATFGRDDSLARVRFGTEAENTGTVALPADFVRGVRKVLEMVVWAYGGRRRDEDRIHALQNVVARNLRGKSAAESYSGLVMLAADIEREKSWFWATYWEGKLGEYFDRVAQVMKFVDEVRRTYEGQIQRLTKSLADNVLAGVAVVVGTFIAALLKSDFDATLFRLGTLLYTAYLYFFPALFGLAASWNEFDDARRTFASRARLFRAHLYEKSVDSVLEPVAAAETRFGVWFALTAVVYLVVCCLLLLGALVVPRLVA